MSGQGGGSISRTKGKRRWRATAIGRWAPFTRVASAAARGNGDPGPIQWAYLSRRPFCHRSGHKSASDAPGGAVGCDDRASADFTQLVQNAQNATTAMKHESRRRKAERRLRSSLSLFRHLLTR